MRIPRRFRGDVDDGDPMTPMIDVVFLLLVFFICASVGTVADKLLPAELRGTTTAETKSAEPPQETWTLPVIQVRLEPDAGGMRILLDQQSLPGLEVLSSRLQKLVAIDPTIRLVLNIHDDIDVQQFISVYDLCQQLQFQNISFAVNAGQAGRL
jgi:biopolymer transport protein ExbD